MVIRKIIGGIMEKSNIEIEDNTQSERGKKPSDGCADGLKGIGLKVEFDNRIAFFVFSKDNRKNDELDLIFIP